ncbi:hypothetical protein [Microbacterium arborescens]|uniref:hypothetical protein n=1 Tax=Microbacterium TaxID=33882 RepID=UPI0025A30947|nr:hypothetical protein [Microbacterium arborescens]WJM15226.1 hypothetical protein QUC20_13235 [Microbacterium arborescens]
MGWGRTSRRRARLRPGVAIWWDAISGGRFLTIWSALVALPTAALVLAPYATVDTAGELFAAQLAALAVAVVLGVALVPVWFLERRIASPTVRGVLVLSAVVVAATIRPFLNDAVALHLFGLAADPAWLARIITNVVAWISVLSLVAIAEQLYVSSAIARVRLIEALQAVTDEQRRAVSYERESRTFLATEIGVLRSALSALTVSVLDFERVREFSDTVRSLSHSARARAGLDLAEVAPDVAEALVPGAERAFLERLRPPAVGLVGAIFAAGSAPFALRTGGPALVVLIAGGIVALCLVADVVSRRVAYRRSARDRGLLLIIVWVGVAVVIAGAAPVVGVHSLVPLIPVVALPGVAVIAALCSEAVHRGRVESRRLGRALQAVVRSAADRASGVRQELVRASEVLHGRVQGSCVILAAQVDDDMATRADILAFEKAVGDGLMDAAGGGGAAPSRPADLAETVAIWGPVLSVSSDVDAVATRALTDELVSTRVVAVVAEGLVNAVKHAAARSAAIEVHGDGAGSSLAVRVRTPGRLRVDSRGPGLGVAGLGPTARVFQHGRDVVLEVSVPTGEPELVGAGQAGGALHDSDSM